MSTTVRRTRCRVLIAPLVAALAIALAGCGGDDSSSKKSAPTSTTTTTRSSTTTTRPVLPEGWEQLAAAPGLLGKYAVWTGSEYLGGPLGCCEQLGGTEVDAYSPANASWRTLAPFPLGERDGEGAVWTGDEMIVVGGRQARSAAEPDASKAVPTATGAALDPVTNTWRTIAPMPAPGPSDAVWSREHAVWTGKEVIAFDATHLFRYDPVADTWTAGTPPPFTRYDMTIAWSGKELLLWAGADEPQGDEASLPASVQRDGAAYDPTTDHWRTIPRAPVPARMASKGVWTGHRFIVWGGYGADGPSGEGNRGLLGKGAAYDPTTNSWTALPASPLEAREGHQMVWTDREVLVWGGRVINSSGEPSGGYPRDGAVYDPATNTWRALPAAPASPPSLLSANTAVWTGDVALFVGGAETNTEGVGPLGLSYAPGR